MRTAVTVGCLALGLLALGSSQSVPGLAATRGIEITPKDDATRGDPRNAEALYGASHALVIGIDAYDNGWPRLSNAVEDARLVAEELRRRGFAVTLKTDPTSRELERAFEEFFVVTGAEPEARLFVWFAGHGHTENGESYLIPTDAPRPSAGVARRLGER